MSSIDERQRKALIRFYRANILSLAGESAASQAPSKAARPPDSYYLVRDWKPLRREDFEIELGDRTEVAAALDAFWSQTPLCGLGNKIARLSRKFADVQQRSDVSSFIYEMF